MTDSIDALTADQLSGAFSQQAEAGLVQLVAGLSQVDWPAFLTSAREGERRSRERPDRDVWAGPQAEQGLRSLRAQGFGFTGDFSKKRPAVSATDSVPGDMLNSGR